MAEGSAIYVRLHHALADGIALTQVLMSLTDETETGDLDNSERRPVKQHVVGEVVEAARTLAPEVPGMLKPAKVRANIVCAVKMALSGIGVLRKLLFTTNPASPVAGEVGTTKRAAWSDPIDLAQIKDDRTLRGCDGQRRTRLGAGRLHWSATSSTTAARPSTSRR